MIIRALDNSHDWTWGNSLGDFLTGQAAVEENVQTSILCFKNDYSWDTQFGIDWFTLLSEKNPAAETGILLQVRQVISQSYGIVAINSVDAVEDSASRAIQILYNLSSIFSTQFAGTAQPLAS